MAAGIDEGLHQHRGEPIAPLPVARQAAQAAPEHMGGQMRNRDLGQDQKARVGHHLIEVRAPRRLAPADEAIPRAKARRGALKARPPSQP